MTLDNSVCVLALWEGGGDSKPFVPSFHIFGITCLRCVAYLGSFPALFMTWQMPRKWFLSMVMGLWLINVEIHLIGYHVVDLDREK